MSPKTTKTACRSERPTGAITVRRIIAICDDFYVRVALEWFLGSQATRPSARLDEIAGFRIDETIRRLCQIWRAAPEHFPAAGVRDIFHASQPLAGSADGRCSATAGRGWDAGNITGRATLIVTAGTWKWEDIGSRPTA